MVIVHGLKSEGLHLRIDIELKDEEWGSSLPGLVITGILLQFTGRISSNFINPYLREHLPGFEDCRKELVLEINALHRQSDASQKRGV